MLCPCLTCLILPTPSTCTLSGRSVTLQFSVFWKKPVLSRSLHSMSSCMGFTGCHLYKACKRDNGYLWQLRKVKIPEQVGKGSLHCPVSRHWISSGPSSSSWLLQKNCNLYPILTLSFPGESPITLRRRCSVGTIQVMSGAHKTEFIMKYCTSFESHNLNIHTEMFYLHRWEMDYPTVHLCHISTLNYHSEMFWVPCNWMWESGQGVWDCRCLVNHWQSFGHLQLAGHSSKLRRYNIGK